MDGFWRRRLLTSVPLSTHTNTQSECQKALQRTNTVKHSLNATWLLGRQFSFLPSNSSKPVQLLYDLYYLFVALSTKAKSLFCAVRRDQTIVTSWSLYQIRWSCCLKFLLWLGWETCQTTSWTPASHSLQLMTSSKEVPEKNFCDQECQRPVASEASQRRSWKQNLTSPTVTHHTG